MTSTIRRAQTTDAAPLASLLRSIGWFTRIESEPEHETIATVARHLRQCCADDSHSIYVALDGDDLVGYISVHWLPYLFLRGPEGFVSELFMSETARGNGIGTRLLETVEAEARQRGCSRLQLINFRIRDSYRRGFYTKAGWEERPDGASFVRRIGE
jgi:GNAT superfamily N-acetyltransferase